LSAFTKVGLAVFLASVPLTGLAGQTGINQFSYDNLRPSAIQLDIGMLSAAQLQGTTVGGVRMDFGRIAPKVRLLLGVSFYRAQLDQETTTRFEQRIRDFVIDPSGDDTIAVGEIFWGNLVLDMDFQYVIPQGKVVTTYIGAGIGVQLRNGSGQAIDGTFIEDALDQLAAAGNVSIALEARLTKGVYFTADARGALSVGLATISARFGVMYRWAGER
jgi:hypothetical protein